MKSLTRWFTGFGAVILFHSAFASETASWWLTTPDKAALLAGQSTELNFVQPGTASQPVIVVDPKQQYQSIDGFGFALTGGSADHLMSLPAPERRKLLEELGHEVEDAGDGSEALEKYVLNQHDLVVLDMVMHGMYGLEVLEKFQQLNPKLPVIIATADIQRSTREQVRQAGASAMVNKPINREEMAEVLAVVIAGGNLWT